MDQVVQEERFRPLLQRSPREWILSRAREYLLILLGVVAGFFFFAELDTPVRAGPNWDELSVWIGALLGVVVVVITFIRNTTQNRHH